ncbi:MAG TPA: hypothetical protein VKM55_02585 [Candidatus Lokiarchaeia archaeon]|nr:hypothetical protein [Candidatus Lokiarchaeia archaeon]
MELTNGCDYCSKQATARCSSCGKFLCNDHDIFEDPYHTGGFLYRPAHWCKPCFSKRQGKGPAICIVILAIALGAFIAWMILSPP